MFLLLKGQGFGLLEGVRVGGLGLWKMVMMERGLGRRVRRRVVWCSCEEAGGGEG